MKKWLIVLFLIIGFSGCSGGEDSNDNSTINLTLKSTYELPYIFGSINQNVILDEDSIVFIGGNNASPSGAQHDGHPAFSNKAIKIDLISGVKQILDINASSGHTYDGGTVANGRGNSAYVKKIDSNKYFVSGGFQYVENMEIIDFNNEIVKNIESNFQIVYDARNTTTYYANSQANAMSNNEDIFFFGFNNGGYGMNTIVKYNKSDENLTIVDTNLTIARSKATAHKLADGKIIIIGGWDGTAHVTPDSATRRVEIFNPNDNSIIKVSDYPEPIHNGQRAEKSPVENDSICVGNYQYIISQDKWKSGCSITTVFDDFDRSKYLFPGDTVELRTYNGKYIGTLSNGDIVYMENGNYLDSFSDKLLGYPIDEPTKIYIFSE